jgi:BirA family biotin operon repressor/biotin-[acetyl-CoA-carboxylase] ligase
VTLERTDCVLQEGERRARQGAEEGTIIQAMEQTDSRTRGGHPWFSPRGNLYCSLILRPDYPNSSCGQLAYVATVSAGSALASCLTPMTGLRYRWPGELFINDLKAGRISLSVPEPGTDPYDWLVLALMLNIEQHPANPEPEEFNSVHASGATEVTAEQVLEGFARHFLSWINRWAEEGFEPIGRLWQQRADGLGEPITVELEGETVSGTFAKIDEQGRLLVKTTGDGERRVDVCDYFRLRR